VSTRVFLWQDLLCCARRRGYGGSECQPPWPRAGQQWHTAAL